MPVRFDYETFSCIDLKKAGMFRYLRHPSSEALCLSVKVDDAPTVLWRPDHGPISHWMPELAYRAKHRDTFHGWNVGFEFVATNGPIGQSIGMPALDITQMRDSAARAASLALPRGMGNCAKALKLPIQKDEEGRRVMLKLSQPRTPTKLDISDRWTLKNANDDFATLYRYCINDTDTETGIDEFLGPLSAYEQAVWEMDFRINDRGVPIDINLARNVIKLRDEYMARLTARCQHLCGFLPSQVAEILKWINGSFQFQLPLKNNYGQISLSSLPTLAKEDVSLAISAIEAGKAVHLLGGVPVPIDSPIYEVLRIRQQTSQTSLAKFDTVLNAIDDDHRIRGMFMYWGAGPGRWTGKIVQFHNVKKPVIGAKVSDNFKKKNKGYLIEDKEYNLPVHLARIVSAGSMDLRTLERLYARPMDALSSIIRPVVKAPEGDDLIVVDYSSVESRIISWLSGEEWRLEVFRTHGKIYEATASKLSGKPIEEIGKGSMERQSGKVTELALGFQGGVRALIKMGAIDKYGLKYAQLKPLVRAWREANPKIAAMWKVIEEAVLTAMRTGTVVEAYKCRFGQEGMFFFIQLPSGRKIAYAYPRLRTSVRVWNEDEERFENFNEDKHPRHPHKRARFNQETMVWENYEHPGFKPMSMTQFVFEGENDKRQWVTQDAYGGLETENIVQGIGACLLRGGLLATENAGYQNVLHVHDEGAAQARKNFGSVAHYRDLLCTKHSWAEGLPLKGEGYRAPEYHKDD